MADDVYIISAMRTPQGRFLGSLVKHSAVDLAVAAGGAALKGLSPEQIGQTIIGNVLTAGQGMNVARQVALRVGVPESRPAFTVNMVCGSGLLAIRLGAQVISSGETDVVLCGGTESMSNAPYLAKPIRQGHKFGDTVLTDAILRDGLTDPITNEHMGDTAERLATEYGISREQQDIFACQSHMRAADATRAGGLSGQITPVAGLSHDEHMRPDTTLESLAKLAPAFSSNGSVTAGNASGINDGAAMLVLASGAAVQRNGWTPMAVILGSTMVGCDPRRMGLGPVFAVRQLIKELRYVIDDFDAVEINEAFASQTLACLKDLDIKPEAGHVNVSGGAIALGHPIGASGARLIVHLTHQINDRSRNRGLATLCVGGGMGCAMAIQRCDQ